MNLSLDKLPINLFDLLLVITLVFGIHQGRKHGMSGELLRLLQWLAILFGCSFAYEPLGDFINHSTDFFTPLAAYITAYIIIAALILLLFIGVRRALGEKLIGSDIFGHTEFYLGMGSGLIRFVCILLAVLALMNARAYTAAEVKANLKFQNDVYGSNFFPTFQTVQSSIFEKSLTGPYIRQYLGFLLIKPTHPPQSQQYHQLDAFAP